MADMLLCCMWSAENLRRENGDRVAEGMCDEAAAEEKGVCLLLPNSATLASIPSQTQTFLCQGVSRSLWSR